MEIGLRINQIPRLRILYFVFELGLWRPYIYTERNFMYKNLFYMYFGFVL
jgi:hypothetical protein